jgi:hypothetical protein
VSYIESNHLLKKRYWYIYMCMYLYRYTFICIFLYVLTYLNLKKLIIRCHQPRWLRPRDHQRRLRYRDRKKHMSRQWFRRVRWERNCSMVQRRYIYYVYVFEYIIYVYAYMLIHIFISIYTYIYIYIYMYMYMYIYINRYSNLVCPLWCLDPRVDW